MQSVRSCSNDYLKISTGTAIPERHYGHTSNVASAAELTKGGQFKGEKNAKALDWLTG